MSETRLIKLYVCPTEGCASYYGSASMADLATADIVKGSLQHKTWEKPGEVLGQRDECPDCKARGVGVVKRQLLTLRIVVEAEDGGGLRYLGASAVTV
jgi:hypothetical protein